MNGVAEALDALNNELKISFRMSRHGDRCVRRLTNVASRRAVRKMLSQHAHSDAAITDNLPLGVIGHARTCTEHSPGTSYALSSVLLFVRSRVLIVDCNLHRNARFADL